MTFHPKEALAAAAPRRLLLFGVLAVLAGCGRPAAAPSVAPGAAESTPAVAVVKPERKTLRRLIEQPAFVEAFEETPLVVRIPGYVQKVNVDIGDRVRKDDVLAELAVPELEVEVKQKEALIRQAEAEQKLAGDAVLLAEAEFRRMKSQAERFAKVGSAVIDKENIEETQFGFEASKARLEIARSDVAVKEARTAVARRNRDFAGAMLHYSRITAPYDGVVVRRNVHTGHFLQPGAGAAAQPIFVVARLDRVRVFAEVPETDARFVSDGMPARVRVQSLRDEEFSGTVTRSSWALDAKARTLRVEIDLPAQGRLRPAMYAYVTLTAEFPNRFTLPAAAVAAQGAQLGGFLLQDGKAVAVALQVGLRDGATVEVLKKRRPAAGPDKPAVWEDLTGAEQFIVGGLSGLKDGQAVTVAPAK